LTTATFALSVAERQSSSRFSLRTENRELRTEVEGRWRSR
jgi:hypothetical protein